MKVLPLASQEQASNDGFNWQFVLDADDLTQTTAATAQVINLRALAIGDIVRSVVTRVKVPFQNTADAAFNTTAVTVGDTGSATRFTASQETNTNGTVLTEAQGPSAAVAPYAAADTMQITFNSMTAKSLSNINKGELHVFVKLLRPSVLAGARSTETILTK